MNTTFWFLAGTLTGFAATLVIMPLWRASAGALANRTVRIATTAVGAVVFGLTAILLYRTLGNPELVGASASTTANAHPQMQGPAADEAADSMESVVARLEARVARDGGKPEDWLLLAQSYDFMGRGADAERARKNAGSGGTKPQAGATDTASTQAASVPVASVESLAEQERAVRSNPRDSAAWRALAELYRRQHAYEKARDAFAQLQKLNGMTADTWADQADVLASLNNGSLKGDPARAIERALALNPRHAKALWLKASFAHEDRRYADALSVWQQLRAALPPDSPDLRIVDANIGEAKQLAATREEKKASAAVAATAASNAAAEVTGTVTIDRALAARVPRGATLYIYAKAADSPGPPLAVLRQVAGTWPVKFRLDDSLAMMPTRRLSQFQKVVVEARISQSGQATPTAGDLYVTSAVFEPRERKKLDLVINLEVG